MYKNIKIGLFFTGTFVKFQFLSLPWKGLGGYLKN